MNSYDIIFFYEEYWFSWGVKTYIDEINKSLKAEWLKTCTISLINGENCISLCNLKNLYIYISFWYIYKLFTFLRKNRTKIIHCQSLYSILLINFIKRFLGYKITIISTAHIPYADSIITKILWYLGLKPKVNHLIWCCKWALNETVKKNIISYDKSEYILNWSNSFIKEHVKSDNTICFIWHLAFQKNIDLLSELIFLLPQFKFKIIWEWDEKYKLENYKNAILLWRLSHDDTIWELKKSRLLLLPSRYEALPYVILESLSLNIPVVSSNVWGISELNKLTNMLFLCNKKTDYVNNILQIYKGDSKYYNNIESISFDNQILKYKKIYKSYL